MRNGLRVGLIVPALDEESAIGRVVRSVPGWVDDIIVVDNGSRDETAAKARAAGARVILEPRKGYGHACLAGLRQAGAWEVVVFADGDFGDDLGEMERLVDPLLQGRADLVLGSRMRQRSSRSALRPLQIAGNALVCALIRLRWGVTFTDLAPFRAIRRSALEALAPEETGYGWTVEMQVAAVRAGLRVLEVPVSYRARIGVSKVSGTFRGSVAAGGRIVWLVLRAALSKDRSSGRWNIRAVRRDSLP